MTLKELINQINSEKPSAFSSKYLVTFVNEVEQSIQEYLGTLLEDRITYMWPDSEDAVLIAPPPYDMLYKSYLKAKIDFAQEEYDSYANNVEQFNADMAEYEGYTQRENLIIKTSANRYITNWF